MKKKCGILQMVQYFFLKLLPNACFSGFLRIDVNEVLCHANALQHSLSFLR